MSPRLVILAALALLVASIAAAQSPPPGRGHVLPLYAADPEFDYGWAIDEIAATGANIVELTHVWMQADARATDVRDVPGRTAPEAALRRTIQQARAAGLDVLVLPIVLLENPVGDEWRGNMHPADRAAWHASYRAQLLKIATICHEEGVAWLAVGSELSSMEQDTDAWRAHIAAAREAAPATRLLYSCNWDHLEGPSAWWGELDAIGCSAYYELTADVDASPAVLKAAWEHWRGWILEWREGAGLEHLPIIFTEVGYPSLDGGAAWPWDYTRDAPVDLDEQRLAIDAFIAAWDGRPELHAAFFYKWIAFDDDDLRSYSVRGKPADAAIRAWFRGGEPAPASDRSDRSG